MQNERKLLEEAVERFRTSRLKAGPVADDRCAKFIAYFDLDRNLEQVERASQNESHDGSGAEISPEAQR